MKRIWWLIFWQLLPLTGAHAFVDIVTSKDGSQISGSVDSGGGKLILIKTGDHSHVIAIDQILSIQFDPPADSAAHPALVARPAPVAQTAAAPSSSITLPAGTEIAVRTTHRINSKTADTYREYAASLDDPIVVDGMTVVPANANAVLRVAAVQKAGFARRASLSMTLIAVTIDGRRVEVETGKVDSQSGSQAKRTATGAAIGAGGGAAVGAAAGGAVGAGIGAGVGAAAGAVTGKMMGKEVEIPSETRFTYKLTRTLVIDRPESSR